MKIVLAEKIGFCFGVKRAIEMAQAALKKRGPIYSLGSIIHNAQVVDDLSSKGLKVVKDIRGIKEGTIVISSHGISPKIAARISKQGLRLIDTTCPFVLNAQRIAKRLSDEGYAVVIVGDVNHPEVKALVDFVKHGVSVVKGKKEAARLRVRHSDRVSIISQTTQSTDNFLDVVKTIIEKRPKEIRIFNTICKDAEERQGAARRLARRVDVMLTVGGKDSANTKRLFEVCKEVLKRSFLVESKNELRGKKFMPGYTIGITSGASTPEWVVRQVVSKIKLKGKSKKAKV
ncbi:MAG: 4-hydroxy-3-methylbut-2-enyl diphosphate reductase [Candidatus Omnitrophota bacterium]|nr:4-hydroxy-3-methylbut-2-enyl diphosphate reductase [Candidatus Omnitrophota bacterium]